MKHYFLLIFLCVSFHVLKAQELFPYAEAASTQAKGIPAVRLMYENYRELPSQRARFFTGIRTMYGLTEKLTVGLTVTAANHHRKKFPADLSNYFQNHHQKSYPQNPYQLEGIIASLKYRFISVDGHQTHFRMALMGSAAKSFVPHDGAEPRLGDNSGLDGSWIATLLLKRFAISLTNGYLFPFAYRDNNQALVFKSGDKRYVNLSLGYRLIPKTYSAYSNVNVNIYCEFIFANYDKASMNINGQPYYFDNFQYYDKYIYNSLQANTYLEMRPSVQLIFYSNTRLEAGVATKLASQTYLYFYPMYFISLQKTFFKNKKIHPSR